MVVGIVLSLISTRLNKLGEEEIIVRVKNLIVNSPPTYTVNLSRFQEEFPSAEVSMIIEDNTGLTKLSFSFQNPGSEDEDLIVNRVKEILSEDIIGASLFHEEG